MHSNIVDHDDENRFTFIPPLCKQRDDFVFDILTSEKVKSVLDLGCGECRFLRRMIRIPGIEKIVGVEKLEYLISSKMYVLRPLNVDYLIKRLWPLDIKLYSGDITMFDERLQNYDAALLIEIIEHLQEDELDRLPSTLFGAMQPTLVVITTPNFEFNICFNNDCKLRHWDHKFEWTRNQFEQWCSSICSSYAYSVTFDGVGDPPDAHPDIGHCTQIAIFRKLNSNILNITDDILSQEFKMVCEVTYPWVGSIKTEW